MTKIIIAAISPNIYFPGIVIMTTKANVFLVVFF